MLDGYSTQLASYIGGTDPSGEVTREGWAYGLLDETRTPVAEVFEEESTGLRTVSDFSSRPIPLPVLTWFLERVAERL